MATPRALERHVPTIAAALLLAACLAAPFPAPGFATAARAAGDEYWSAQFAPTGVAHVNGSFESVTALASLDGSLYVGGDFSRAGGLTSLNIARWDAATGWTALRPTGPGVGTYAIRDMIIFDGELVVAGDFDWGFGMKNIARWDGSTWQPLWAGLSGRVSALAIYDGALIAGGSFTNADGVPVSFIARWDGTSWSALGSGLSSTVEALAVYDGELVATGSFLSAGGTAVSRIAAWDGTTWHGLGTGLSGIRGLTLLVQGTDLYVGGQFFAAGGTQTPNVARWDGAAWHGVGGGLVESVAALTVFGGEIIAGGQIFQASGQPAGPVMRWNGATWIEIPGEPIEVKCLEVHDGRLITGGTFATVDGILVNRVGAWTGTTWQTLDDGRGLNNNYVRALAQYNGAVHAGGTFNGGGGAAFPLNAIAAWDGSGWDALGSGLNGACNALCAYGSSLVAGGTFNTAGGTAASRIAAWNGAQWAPLGTGVNSTVTALAVYGGDLIAGGDFTAAGSASGVGHIARWDGSAWHALGTGLGGSGVQVLGMAEFEGSLYVGGAFTLAGGQEVQDIARWDGSSWHAVPGTAGTNHAVYGLCVHNGRLVAGGVFTSIGGIEARGLAAYDGATWAGLGYEAVAPFAGVQSVASANGLLIVGGYPAPGVWTWNGVTWSGLGTGSAGARAVLGTANGIYAGIDGITAGGKPSAYIARWDGPADACAIAVTAPAAGASFCEGEAAVVEWAAGGNCAANVRIALLRDGVECRVLAASTPNTGSYDWVPERCNSAAGAYTIRVDEAGAPGSGSASGAFTIEATGVPVVTYPRGGEAFAAGSAIDVTWSGQACGGANVRLELVGDGIVCGEIAATTANDGLYTWVPTPCNQATTYAIRVTDLSSGGADESNGSFQIVSDFGIASIADIRGDQGRQVRVRWAPHPGDAADAIVPIASYSLWRRIDGAKQAAAAAYPPGAWDSVAWVPAGREDTYSVVSPTMCDSTVASGACWSVFFLRAHTMDPAVFFDSPPDSGWSVDNLAPAAPKGLACAQQGVLAWQPAPEADFAHYSVYEANSDHLDDSASLLGRTTGTELDLTSVERGYLLVTATDLNGNESAAAAVVASACSQEILPARFQLLPCVPNPFNPQTMIRFDLPSDSLVSLRIYDVSGRCVATLADGEPMAAGRREVAWHGNDAQGRAVAAGTYFCRLEAGSFSETQGMTLLR
jgi:hypothetical protein